MSRPYSKRGQFRGRGGGGNFNNDNRRGGDRGDRSAGGGGPGGRGGRWNNAGGRGGGGGGGRDRDRNNGGSNPTADVMKTLLKLLVEKSYGQIFDDQMGMLIISKMREAEDLLEVQKSVDFNSVSFCKALCEVLKDKFGNNIRIVRLDENNIQKFGTILDAFVSSGLHESITAISAQNNQIADLQFLSTLKDFRNLNELMLTGNRVTMDESYSKLVTRRLPALALLDGEVVTRNMLRIQNPLWVDLSPEQSGISQFLMTNLSALLMERNFDALVGVYNTAAVASVSCPLPGPPFPNQIPCSVKHNTNGLLPEHARAMKSDLSQLRNKFRWRNIAKDPATIKNVVRGKPDIILRQKEWCGGNLPFHVKIVNSHTNVEFLSNTTEPWMNYPVCIATIHGTLRYYWSAKNMTTEIESCPFISCFFDRTVSLVLSDNTWTICNDMLHIRPDKQVTYNDGSLADSVFFGFSPERMERLRRRLFAEVPIEAFRELISQIASQGMPSSDFVLQQVVHAVKSSPPEVASAAFQSIEGLAQFVASVKPVIMGGMM